jgi:hypothetical protein
MGEVRSRTDASNGVCPEGLFRGEVLPIRSILKPTRPLQANGWEKHPQREVAKGHPKTLNCKREERPHERRLRLQQVVDDCSGFVATATFAEKKNYAALPTAGVDYEAGEGHTLAPVILPRQQAYVALT